MFSLLANNFLQFSLTKNSKPVSSLNHANQLLLLGQRKKKWQKQFPNIASSSSLFIYFFGKLN
jgi:hypothetical protein